MSSTQYVYSKQQFISDVSFNSALTFAGETTFTAANTIINGNVGVGTTSPASKLHINGSSVSQGTNISRIIQGSGSFNSVTDAFQDPFTINSATVTADCSNLSIGMGVDTTNKIGYINVAQSGSVRPLYLNCRENSPVIALGNVGIGTTNPGAILDVNGNAIINGSINSGSISIISGTVGIGTTAPPTYYDTKLKVNGHIQCNSVFNDFTTHTFNNNTSLGNWFKIAEFSGRAYGLIELMSAWNNEHMHLRFSAGVLYNMKPFIKIISNTFLDTSIIDSIRLSLNQTSNSGCIEIKIASDGNSALATYQQVQIKLIENMSMTLYALTTPGTTSGHTYYTLPLTVSEGMNTNGNLVITDMNGNVGIGTTSPGNKLHVEGGSVASGTNLVKIKMGNGSYNNVTDSVTDPFTIISADNSLSIGMGVDTTTRNGYINCAEGGAVRPIDISRRQNAGVNLWGNVGIETAAPQRALTVNGLMNSKEIRLVDNDQTISNNTTHMDVGSNADGHYLWGYGASKALRFATNQNERMRISAAGNVGIGTTNPSYPLEVHNSYYATFTGYGYLNSMTISNSSQSDYIGINVADGAVRAARGFYVNSDKRIKTNIVDIDDGNALSILRQIQPKTYDYVDKLQRGNANVIGFIAQEIKEVLSNAVTIVKDYAPTFYTICQVVATDASNILLVTSPIDLSWNPLHDPSGNAFVDAEGNACSDAAGNKVFNVKLYDQSNNNFECKTTSILDKRSFLMDVSGSKMVDASGNLKLVSYGKYFLHGQEVDDFHNIDKAAIFTVVTAAVQDIDRKQQEDEVKIAALESKNAALEALVAQQNQQIAQQQSQINAILAKIGGV